MILGIFDSGLGGLTVLKEIINNNSYEKIIYYGDTLRVPYGEKNRETLFELARNDIDFLLQKGAEEIIAACGTVSSNVLEEIRKEYSVKITGIIDVACKQAIYETKNNRIGVIATPATIDTHVFANKIVSYNNRVSVFEVPCKKFAPLIEAGKTDSKEMDDAIDEYLHTLKDSDIDTLVLGCTHYPLIENKISKYFDNKVVMINSGKLLSKSDNLKESKKPEIEFYVSGDKDDFKKLAKKILDIKEIDSVKNC